MSFRSRYRSARTRFSSWRKPRKSSKRRRTTSKKFKIFGFSATTVAIVGVAAYFFIAPVKSFINSLMGKTNV